MRYHVVMDNLAHEQETDATVPTIAANIRAEIARAGMTDAEFAEQFGMSPMGVSRRLSNITPFTTSEVAHAAQFFGVTIESLYTAHQGPVRPVRTLNTARNAGKLRSDN
jgi:transcriptional regulator with XRE-family HTH domain